MILDRLTSAARALPEKELEMLVPQAEALAAKNTAKNEVRVFLSNFPDSFGTFCGLI
ncbi:MAG: hypothetical protein AAFO73_09765 [Pseudomonadota bacterium]